MSDVALGKRKLEDAEQSPSKSQKLEQEVFVSDYTSDDEWDRFYDAQAMPLAFAIDGESEPTGLPPATAEEYLRQVRWQANRCPNVVVAQNDPKPIKQTISAMFTQSTPPTPAELKPTKAWETNFLDTFKQFRASLEEQHANLKSQSNLPKLPSVYSKKQWKQLCFGSATAPAKKPSPSIVLQLDFVSLLKVWFEKIHYLMAILLNSLIILDYFISCGMGFTGANDKRKSSMAIFFVWKIRITIDARLWKRIVFCGQ